MRIIRSLEETYRVDPSCFETQAEHSLFADLSQAETSLQGSDSVDAFLGAITVMVPTINRFFDEVLVMAEDVVVRQNRLALMQRIAGLAKGIANLSYLEGF